VLPSPCRRAHVYLPALSSFSPRERYLRKLKAAGLGSLPGTAAEVLDDGVRDTLCPDKLSTAQWLEVPLVCSSLAYVSSDPSCRRHLDGVRAALCPDMLSTAQWLEVPFLPFPPSPSPPSFVACDTTVTCGNAKMHGFRTAAWQGKCRGNRLCPLSAPAVGPAFWQPASSHIPTIVSRSARSRLASIARPGLGMHRQLRWAPTSDSSHSMLLSLCIHLGGGRGALSNHPHLLHHHVQAVSEEASQLPPLCCVQVVGAAHRAGIRTSSTIMFGHVDGACAWARHLLALRSLQAATGGITEFVPLPFVHMQAPIYLKGGQLETTTQSE